MFCIVKADGVVADRRERFLCLRSRVDLFLSTEKVKKLHFSDQKITVKMFEDAPPGFIEAAHSLVLVPHDMLAEMV